MKGNSMSTMKRNRAAWYVLASCGLLVAACEKDAESETSPVATSHGPVASSTPVKATGPLAALAEARHPEIPASVIPGKHADLWLKHNAAKRTADTIKALFKHVKATCKVNDQADTEPADCTKELSKLFSFLSSKSLASFSAKGDYNEVIRKRAQDTVSASWDDIVDANNPALFVAMLNAAPQVLSAASDEQKRKKLAPFVLGNNKALAIKSYPSYLHGGLRLAPGDVAAAGEIMKSGKVYVQELVPRSLYKSGMVLHDAKLAEATQSWLTDPKITADIRVLIANQIGSIRVAKAPALETLEGVGKIDDPKVAKAVEDAIAKLKK
jgi:hypothetical protein